MIYATHDPVEAMALGGRIVVMNDGAVQQDGTRAGAFMTSLQTSSSPDFVGDPPMNLVRGTLKQERDSLLFSEAGEGTIEVRLPVSEFPGGKDFAGKPVVLGIRPEEIEIAASPADERSGSFPALVELVEPRAPRQISISRPARTRWFAGAGAGDRSGARPATGCSSRLNLKNVCLFDPVSGRGLCRSVISFVPESCVNFLLPFQGARG